MLSSQEIRSSLVSFKVIFEALQSELFILMLHWLSSKILKIAEFNLNISKYQVFRRVELLSEN